MTAAVDTSDSPAHKLQAAICHDWPEGEFFVAYLRACRQWYGRLSEHDTLLAAKAAFTYRTGDKGAALEIATALPAAPTCPVID